MTMYSHHTCEPPRIAGDITPLPHVAVFIRARRGARRMLAEALRGEVGEVDALLRQAFARDAHPLR